MVLMSDKNLEKIPSLGGKGLTYSSSTDPLLKKALINSIEFASGRSKIQKLYRELEVEKPEGPKVWHRILEKLDIGVDLNQMKLLNIPESGPVILISNHPFGVLDGLVLGHIMALRRSDFSVIVNEVLTREKLLRDYLLPIDFRDSKEALETNIETRKLALERLMKGEALAIFPAGGVATSVRPFDKKAEDLEWKRFVIKILIKSKAVIVPIFFYGQNSRLFQLASHINANLRLGLLLHEVRNKMGTTIKVEIREPIKYENIPEDIDRQELLNFLKQKTFGE
jgi:putative hemolysin